MTTQYQNRIVIDPEIMVGKPTIKGTRITVELILRQLAQGLTTKEILENYPRLTAEDIYAAIKELYEKFVTASETKIRIR